ncbi:32171_t:CDS:1, partial [Racocetra persica]
MGFSPRAQYATNVRILVKCIECNCLRVLYSQHRLNPEEKNLLKNFLETIDYTCGTTFYGISDFTKASPPSFRNNNNCSINNNEVELQDADNDINGDGDYDGDGMKDDERFTDDGDYDSDGMEDGERFNNDGDYDADGMEDGERFIDERSVDESFTELQNTENSLSLEILFKQIFVNVKLTCMISMEVPYFSSRLYPDVCFQYGDTEIFSPTPA